MEDKQKVYIQGVENRGKEVINALKKLGGINKNSHSGNNKYAYYYINPKGIIDYIYIYAHSPEYLLVKEFYKEIELPEKESLKWKPKYKDCYYHISVIGDIIRGIWVNSQIDKLCLEFGNCFKTKEEAEIARDKIKELLNNKA